MAEETSVPAKGKMVPLVWGEPGMAVFANQIVIQYDGNSVYIAFGQTSPPVILGETDEEKQRQLDRIQSLPVLPVVRVAMTPESFRSMADALQKHLAIMGKIDASKQ